MTLHEMGIILRLFMIQKTREVEEVVVCYSQVRYHAAHTFFVDCMWVVTNLELGEPYGEVDALRNT
jgi:hypothetical protein